MRFYGTNEETYAVTADGVFCIQSPDLLATGGEFAKCAALPEGSTELEGIDPEEMGLCMSCVEVNAVRRAVVEGDMNGSSCLCQDCSQRTF